MIASSKKYGLTYDDYIIGAILLYTVNQAIIVNAFIGCGYAIFMDSCFTCSNKAKYFMKSI